MKENEEFEEGLLEKRKRFIIEFIITFCFCAVFCVIVALLLVFVKGDSFEDNTLRVIGDSFFVSGLLVMLFWILIYLSQEGAFDIIVYGTKKFFNYLLKRHPEDSSLPKTYYDYVSLKREKKKKGFLGILLSSLLFLIVGIIISLIVFL